MLWKFILVNSKDLSHIGELSQAKGKKVDLVLGKPGAANFSYPMNAKYAELVQPYKSGIKAMHWPNYGTSTTVPQELYIRNDVQGR